MNVFAAAVGAVFGDPNISTAAVYRFQGVAPSIPCRVVLRRPDDVTEWGAGSRAVVDTVVIDVRVSDAPTLERGDVFVIGDVEHVVTGEPRRDAHRLIWTAEARAR